MALLGDQKKIARKKGLYALGSGVLTIVLWLGAHWILGLVSLGATTYFTYKWFKYRSEWGMRF